MNNTKVFRDRLKKIDEQNKNTNLYEYRKKEEIDFIMPWVISDLSYSNSERNDQKAKKAKIK